MKQYLVHDGSRVLRRFKSKGNRAQRDDVAFYKACVFAKAAGVRQKADMHVGVEQNGQRLPGHAAYFEFNPD